MCLKLKNLRYFYQLYQGQINMNPSSSYHLPVMLGPCLEGLALRPSGIYVDATLGGGGHTRAILQRLGPKAQVFGFDQDEDVREQLPEDQRFKWLPFNFRDLKRSLRLEGISQVDGILADLGVSSHQLDTAERGFSYRFEAELDMRMNRQSPLRACDVLNDYKAADLQNLLSAYGEVRNAKTLAQALVAAREKRPFKTINDLLQVLDSQVRGERLRYLAQVFQALRMEVNDELAALKDFLRQATEVLKPSGRLVVMSYHSLEDRLVKNWLRNGCFEDQPEKDAFGRFETPLRPLNKKVILADAEELRQNPRANAAKLRIGEKK